MASLALHSTNISNERRRAMLGQQHLARRRPHDGPDSARVAFLALRQASTQLRLGLLRRLARRFAQILRPHGHALPLNVSIKTPPVVAGSVFSSVSA